MVLDALGINRGLLGRNTDRPQKGEHDRVPLAGPLGEGAALVGQLDGAIGRGGHEALISQTRDDPRDGDMAHTHHRGQVADAGGPDSVDDLGDRLDIVLSGFVTMGLSEWGEVVVLRPIADEPGMGTRL